MKRYNLNKTVVIACMAFFSTMFFSACKNNIDAPTTPTPTAITTNGTVTTFAGSGAAGFGNGTGTSATFSNPNGVTVDATGNVYVADQANNSIRKITSAGTVTTVTTLSGNGNSGRTNSAIGVSALYNGPTGVAVDAAGAAVYVADYGNNEIRKIITAAGTTNGTVTVLAGSATGLTGKADGTGTAAFFNGPAGVAVDATGNVYVADFNNNLIRKITAAGVVTTLAGSTAGNTNGTGIAASFNGPRSVAVDATGNVYVADANNNLIRKITPAGVVTTLAGNGSIGNADGAGTAASFYYPAGVAVDAAGNVYVADANNNLIRKITPAGTVSSVAGSGYLVLRTPFNGPTGVAVDAAGTIYVADAYRQLIQKVK